MNDPIPSSVPTPAPAPVAAPNSRAILRQQQRIATLVSLITALLFMVLIGLILAVILMAVAPTEQPSLVAYSGVSEKPKKITEPKVQTNVQRKPAAPSMAASKMLVANTHAPTSIPIPEIVAEDISIDIGVGDNFGAGWGDGDGFGGGGGSSFFGQSSNAERVVYVIDFSSSMKKDDRHKLMRAELTESLSKMQNGLQLGMIFFAGPAWVAGDTVKSGVITTPKGKKYKYKTADGHAKWIHDGPKRKVPWWTIDDKEVERITKIVKTTPLNSGTVWHLPLNLALDMKPAPQMIYFMTDGLASGSSNWAEEIGKRAKKMGVTVNCVALMQPRAEKDLKTMAEMTGGQVTMVDAKGKRKHLK